MTEPLETEFFDRDAETVARELIGVTLLVDEAGGIIVESEAYGTPDPVSHGYGGPTGPNAPMPGAVAHARVYRAFGHHWCLNFVCNTGAPGNVVLIRAIEPLHGLRRMIERRAVTITAKLCSGPGRLCQALGIDGSFDGAPLDRPPFSLLQRERAVVVSAGPRVGISAGKVELWRFGLTGSPHLSRPMLS